MTSAESVLPESWELASSERHDESFFGVFVPEDSEEESDECVDFAGGESSPDVEAPVGVGVVVTDGGS